MVFFLSGAYFIMCSDMGIQILDSVCDGHMDCNNLLAAITGLAICCTPYIIEASVFSLGWWALPCFLT